MPWVPCGVVPPAFRAVVPAAALGAAVALGVIGAGCGSQPRDGLGPDEARFSYGDRSATVSLTACGRDGDVVVLAGAEGGIVVQARADLGRSTLRPEDLAPAWRGPVARAHKEG